MRVSGHRRATPRRRPQDCRRAAAMSSSARLPAPAPPGAARRPPAHRHACVLSVVRPLGTGAQALPHGRGVGARLQHPAGQPRGRLAGVVVAGRLRGVGVARLAVRGFGLAAGRWRSCRRLARRRSAGATRAPVRRPRARAGRGRPCRVGRRRRAPARPVVPGAPVPASSRNRTRRRRRRSRAISTRAAARALPPAGRRGGAAAGSAGASVVAGVVEGGAASAGDRAGASKPLQASAPRRPQAARCADSSVCFCSRRSAARSLSLHAPLDQLAHRRAADLVRGEHLVARAAACVCACVGDVLLLVDRLRRGAGRIPGSSARARSSRAAELRRSSAARTRRGRRRAARPAPRAARCAVSAFSCSASASSRCALGLGEQEARGWRSSFIGGRSVAGDADQAASTRVQEGEAGVEARRLVHVLLQQRGHRRVQAHREVELGVVAGARRRRAGSGRAPCW